MRPYHVGILGATGLVGQRLVERLAGHRWFRVQALGASERSVGRTYSEAVRWRLAGAVPESLAELPVRECDPRAMDDCDVVLSALDSGVAREVEPAFRDGGFAVISNSSAFRMDSEVPLLVPEVNADHVALVERQRRAGGGFIVTNPNCSTTGLVIAIAPLFRRFGVRRLVVTTLQAVSGAGMDGPTALDLLDNVLPHIPGEEEKLESEMGKILGELSADGTRCAELEVSAHCHRVGTLDGHLEAVSLELQRSATPAEAATVLEAFDPGLGLPSSAARPIVVRHEPDRPQPRLDRDAGGGMSVVVGRIRRCPVLGLKFEVLSHNTVRGAAGGTVLNAELLAARDLLPRRTAR